MSSLPLNMQARTGQVFPVLTPEQIARVAAHGRTRSVQRGDVLIEAGQLDSPFFVCVDAELEVVGVSEQVITTHHHGQFTGEINLLTGRRGFATIRVARPGDVIELRRDDLLALVQNDSELSEIF